LAVRLAEEMRAEFDDGVWLVELEDEILARAAELGLVVR
jgi:hypothetical protein